MNNVQGGANNRCTLWNGWSENQKQIFYTITDLLAGSYLYHQPGEYRYAQNACCAYCNGESLPLAGDLIYNEASGQGSGFYSGLFSVPYAGSFCLNLNWIQCYDSRAAGCAITAVSRPENSPWDEDMLDHVEELYAMAPSTSACGGPSGNRLYFGATPELLEVFRSLVPARYHPHPEDAPAWDKSGDWKGPHEPFNASLETIFDSRPRGQNQFFLSDSDTVTVNKDGFVQAIWATNMVEIDIDYNFIHDSNPLCTYQLGWTGTQRYNAVWGARGWPREPVAPSGCQGSASGGDGGSGGVVNGGYCKDPELCE